MAGGLSAAGHRHSRVTSARRTRQLADRDDAVERAVVFPERSRDLEGVAALDSNYGFVVFLVFRC